MREHTVAPSRRIGTCVALVFLIGVSYWPVVDNGFVDFDDPAYVTENPGIASGLTLRTLVWAFTAFHQSNWHPLTWLSHAADLQAFGSAPAGHHLVSLALHAANAIVLLLALHAMTGAWWRSAAVAALFATHPLHVESVAWAAERKDVLSTLFAVLVLWIYARRATRPTVASRASIVALFAAGLLAKPMLVTLPFVLLLLDFWPLDRRDHGLRPLLTEKLPLFGLAVASAAVTWVAQRRGGAVAALDVLPFGDRVANAAVAYVTYLLKAAWPTGLGVLYPFRRSIPAWEVAGAFLLLAALTAGIVAARRRAPYAVTGWFWYLGTLVPVIGLVQVGVQSHADRYTYLPLTGIFLAVVWGAADWVGGRRIGVAIAAGGCAVAIGCAAAATHRQAGYWRSSVTLFERTLAVTTDNYVIHNNLGATFTREQRLDEAIEHLRESVRIRPDYAPALSNLGVALRGKGRVEEAIRMFRDAVRFRPSHVEAWLNLGDALENVGDLDGSVAAFREAERLLPAEPSIRARVAAAEGRRASGRAAPGGAAGSSPEARRLFERANALRDRALPDEAEAAYREAIRLDPMFAEARSNLGSVLGRRGRFDEAVVELRRAIEIAPGLAAARVNLGIVLAVRGDARGAEEELTRALRLEPDNATAHYNLGVLLERRGRLPEAIEHYERTLRAQPGYPGAAPALDAARRRL